MKSIFKVSLLAATVAFVVGCQKEEAPKAEATTLPAKIEASAEGVTASTFASDDEKAGYAIGASLAKYLNSNLEKQTELGLDLKKADVLAGVTDVFNGKERLTDEEIQVALQNLDQRVAEIAQQKMAAESEANIKAGTEYQEKFAKEDGVMKTDSGLLYQVITPAEGPKPKDTDTVVVHYSGTLIDGTKFDSSYDRNQPATFPLNAVIPGWTEGVQLMNVGSKYKFVIPAELGYGAQGNQAIPANSTLVFDVELLEIKDAAKPAK
ncbi:MULTISPECIES: FKBP-type peptidyl-prolyl cis-trans isomerase [Aliivibrio]|uniref:Peptidyl-prolyl cis-trans isomerase n=1 Tax=Aliivibrio finisterrensis TaxID=511998 RepID=A0A4Q5KSJ1_9GAMM|nr:MULTISPECIES: FKBP-type peptidyl-prolyl cis-trans isomerase [Aliivibrio]MDD9174848.1 FKBP-type peptidyl-prolyl cis-trans isomerase [Aliivibrio sp. S3TY1]MDD9179675.1 FKBP-type peptidyl-prolyl cis-trans isomerase [Aliivibrio sp. A6]MDD9192205.1 FKBP-type peptidyl-prolyl cis-trans isomerase [Aliivibrio sp. S2TY2]RYU43998.1 FKBP-type peptidyl-prolyl cis-trans isomerase [Aliivibrio finisterrensis]RYU49224.1 FKBP-type peptidyl-prolyl cis-trans isomerase [Aliivibrio finisterrensis]